MSHTLIDRKTTLKSSVTACYHCGDPCKEDTVEYQEKSFCCSGCKTVYQILEENDLCQYYELDQNPGVKLKSQNFGDKFAYLNHEEIKGQLLSFASPQLEKITLSIPDIHCSSCIWLLENLYRLMDGVIESRVNFLRKEMYLSYHPEKTSLRTLVELLTTLGYEPAISLNDAEEKRQRKHQRALLYKIGVSGFCFGNIMLLSFPEYLAFEDYPRENYQLFFGVLNILLSLPIVFYSSAIYFRSAYKSLKAGSTNLDVPIALGILALFGRSLYEILVLQQAGYMDSLAGLIFFLLVGRWVQERTYAGLSFDRDYKSYFPLAVKVLDEAGETFIKPVKELKKGDVIQIHHQELIPTDSVLVSPKAYIDYSFVTGEAAPIERSLGDQIYAGGRQAGNSIRLQVKKEVSQSYLTQLWNHDSFAKTKTHEHPNPIEVISRYFTVAVLMIALITGIIWYLIEPAAVWTTVSSVLIVACPCALALSTPYTFGNAMRILGKNKLYLKNGNVIALLAKLSHLVFDKTGTITQSKDFAITYHGQALSNEDTRAVKTMVTQSTHPLSQKVAEFLSTYTPGSPTTFQEIGGRGIVGKVGEKWLKIGSATLTDANEQASAHMQSRVYVNIDGEVKGYYSIQNQYRTGVLELIQALGKSRKVSLISGDNASEKINLLPYFKDENALNFRQKPEDKLNFIKNLQEDGDTVAMIGDGLNDAGALQQADVGVTVSEQSSNFSPACDAILDARALPKLGQLLRFTQKSMFIVRLSLIISLMYNVIGLAFAVTGQLSPIVAAILMPLSSVSVVAFVVGLTNLQGRLMRLI